jgi:hypothetical protein
MGTRALTESRGRCKTKAPYLCVALPVAGEDYCGPCLVQRAYAKKKPAKYRAVAVKVDGYHFDSKAEARRYHVLCLKLKAGLITDLEIHPRIPLHAAGGALIGHYEADFRYLELLSNERKVEDVKGGKMRRTDMFKWKKKHVELEYGIKIIEVSK